MSYLKQGDAKFKLFTCTDFTFYQRSPTKFIINSFDLHFEKLITYFTKEVPYRTIQVEWNDNKQYVHRKYLDLILMS